MAVPRVPDAPLNRYFSVDFCIFSEWSVIPFRRVGYGKIWSQGFGVDENIVDEQNNGLR
jgi:hypothetical protein